MNSSSTTKGKRATLRQKRQRQSCQNPNPGTATHIWEGSQNYGTFPRGASSLCPTSGAQHWREGPPKHLALENNGEYVQENHRAVGNGEPVLEGLACRLRDSNAKASVWKVHKPHVNTNLKASTGEAGICQDSLHHICWAHATHTGDAPWAPVSGGRWGCSCTSGPQGFYPTKSHSFKTGRSSCFA